MKQLRIFLLLAVILLAGCAKKEHPAAVYAPSDDQRLVIYTSHKQNVYQPIIREFEERTGIWVEVITGGSQELLELLKTDLDPQPDVLFGGGADSMEAFSDYLQSYESEGYSRLPQSYRCMHSDWTPFSILPVVLIYNTKLVDPALLTCWADLLRPEFHGMVAFADPEKSGSCFTALMTYRKALGSGMLPELAEALGRYQADSSGTILTRVASGECLVGITLEETALRRMQSGASIGIVYPSDGTTLIPDCTAIVRNAPHLENAKKFVDFTLSRDVQELIQTKLNRRSVWDDTAPNPLLPPVDSITTLPYNVHDAAVARSILFREWRDAMKEDAK